MGGKRFQPVARLVVWILVLCQVVVQSLALTLHAPDHIYECEYATFSWDGGSPPYDLTYTVGGDTSGIVQDCAGTNDTSVGCYIPQQSGKSLQFTLTDGSNQSATASLVVESRGACSTSTGFPSVGEPPMTTTDGGSFSTGEPTFSSATSVKPTTTATDPSAGSLPSIPSSPNVSSSNGASFTTSSGLVPSNGAPSATPGGSTHTTVSTAPNGSVTTIVNGGGNGNENGNGNGNGSATRTPQGTAVPIKGNTNEDDDQVRVSKKVIPAVVGTILGAFVCLFAFLCFRWKRRQWKKHRPVAVLPVNDVHEDGPPSATSSGNSAQFAPRPLNLVTEMSNTGIHPVTHSLPSPRSPTSPLTSHRYLTQSQIRSQSQQSQPQSRYQLSPPSLHIPPPPPLPPFAPRYQTLPDSKQRSPNRSPSTPVAARSIGRTVAIPPFPSTAHSDESHSMGGTVSEYPASSAQPPYTTTVGSEEDEEQHPAYDGYTGYHDGEIGGQETDTRPSNHYDDENRQPYPYHYPLTTPTSSTPFTTSIATSNPSGPSMSGGSNQASTSLQVIVQKELDTLMRSGDARIRQDRLVPISYPGEPRLQGATSPASPISPLSPQIRQGPRLQVVNHDEEEESNYSPYPSTSKKALSAYNPSPRTSNRQSNRDDSPPYSAADPATQQELGIRRRDMEALADLVAARIARPHSPTSPSATHFAPPPSYA